MKKLLFSLISLLSLTVYANIGELTFVAFDTETTGFSPARERIIEIGAVKFRNGKIIKSTHWLIQPGIPIRNSHIHGLTSEDLTGYPGFADTYRAFQEFVGDSILLAHNASFDVRFMTAEIERNGLEPLPNPVINSLMLFRKWYPDEKNHKLGSLAATLNIPVSAEHRAEDDSATLLNIFNDGLKTRPEITLDEITKTANGTYHFDGTRKK